MAGLLPDSFAGRISFIYSLFLNPWIISAVFATFLAGVSWMMVMTKFEISYAFPFVALNYAIIMFAGFLLFHEVISLPKIIGCFLVVLGIVVISRG